MNNREYFVEIEYNNGNKLITKSESRNINDIRKDNIFSVKYFVKTKENKYYSRKSDTYYNGKRINEESIMSNNSIVYINPYSLTFDEKIDSDNKEELFIEKFKHLSNYIGQYVRVHYILNGVEDSIVGKLEYVDYYNEVILSNNGIPFSIPFVKDNIFITRINTAHENIFTNEFLNFNMSLKDKLILSYGKNYYNKKKLRK